MTQSDGNEHPCRNIQDFPFILNNIQFSSFPIYLETVILFSEEILILLYYLFQLKNHCKISYIWIMRTVTLNLPDALDFDNNEVAMLVAVNLYEQGKLSLGQAAEVAGLTKRTFAEFLGKYNVSIFNYPASDLAQDVANA